MKALKLLFILSAIALIYSQDCNNPLLSSLNIDGLDNPTVPTGNLTFCPNFQNQPACCSAETINGFQSNVQTAIDNLQNLAIQRDRWLTSSHNEVLPNFLSNFFIFNASMQALRNVSLDAFNAATAKFAYLTTAATPLRAAITPLRNNFANYQQARVQCFQTMIDYVASAHCLACNPNYQTLGVNNDGSIILNNRVCTTMKNSCFRYVQLSNFYSLFIALRQLSEQLYEANNFLRGLDLTSTDLVSDIQNEEVPYSQDSQAEQDILDPTVSPPNCTSAANCDWLCTDVFNSAQLNSQFLALGGLPVDSLTYEDIAARATAAPQGVRQPARLLQNDPEDGIDPNANNEDGVTSSTPVETGAAGDTDQEGGDNVGDDDSVIGPNPPTAEGEDDVVATGPITEAPAQSATGTWNPAVGNSGAVIEIVPNPANVALTPVDEAPLRTEAVAFAEPPNPDSLNSSNEGAALSGSLLTASAGLLTLLVMFYLE